MRGLLGGAAVPEKLQINFMQPYTLFFQFCGCTIAGVSLLSDSVMRLVLDKDKTKYADLLVKRRSLYIMT